MNDKFKNVVKPLLHPIYRFVAYRAKLVLSKIRTRAVVLLYHRVAEKSSDPQLLFVSPKHFEEHLEVLNKNYSVLRLKYLKQAIYDKQISDNSVVVTFDDGYSDNHINAVPVLEMFDIPATVFVSSGFVDKPIETISDTLERIFLLSDHLPDFLELEINGISHKWFLDAVTKQPDSWNVTLAGNPSQRHKCYRDLHGLLRPLSRDQREKTINGLISWAGCSSVGRSDRLIMSSEELMQIASSGLVEIGAHGVNHLMMSRQTPEVQKYEISRSKHDLENILNHPVTSFAYPYGGRDAVNSIVMKNVQELGFELACDNFRGTVGLGTNPYSIPRFPVRDWDGDEFSKHLKSFFLE